MGQTIAGDLAETDCQLGDATFVDGYLLQLQETTNIQIDLTATFDTYLVLLELLPDGNLALISVNDDIDPDDPSDPVDPIDTNSQIVFSLQAGTPYFVLANSFAPNVIGDYQLTVTEAGSFALRPPVMNKPGKAPVSTLLRTVRP